MLIATILAARGQTSGAEIVIGIIFILVIAVTSIIVGANTRFDVRIRNGLPHCPRCNRQVTFRRDRCRSCGYQFRTFGAGGGASQLPTTQTSSVPIPISHWEKLHLDPADNVAKTMLRSAIEDALRDRLMGPKKIERDLLTRSVILRRARLQYESHVEVYVGGDRHGFDVAVPSHGFKIRITCPRV